MPRHLDEFEVVWNGGELLPPRNSVPDRTWMTIPRHEWEQENRAATTEDNRAALKPKRIYNKAKHEYWAAKASSGSCVSIARPSTLRPRLVSSAGSHPIAGTRTAGHELKPVPTLALVASSAT